MSRLHFDPEGPVQDLRNLGLPDPPWATAETRTTHEGEPYWEYRTGYLSSKALRDLAFLILDGWQIHIHARSSTIRIRAHKQRPTQ